VISKAKLVVGIDSGPIHMGGGLRVPVIGIYGPTSMVSWGLLGPKSKMLYKTEVCAPCYKDDGNFPECKFDHKCMNELSCDEVFKAIEAIGLSVTAVGLRHAIGKVLGK